MKALLYVLGFLGALVMVTWATSDDERESAVKKLSDILARLYQVLRNIAFPKFPYSPRITVLSS